MLRVLLYAVFWLAIYLADTSYRTNIILMSCLISISAATEVLLQFRKYGVVALLSPYVICILYLFFVAFGISNFIFLIRDYEQYFEYFVYDSFGNFEVFFRSFSHGLQYVFTGFIALVTGYQLEGATKLITRFTSFIFQANRLLISSFDIQLWKILVLWITSTLLKLYAIYLGVYGFTASSIALEKNLGMMQVFSYGFSLSRGALFFLGLLYFQNTKNAGVRFWLVLIMAVELFLGLLSGFKSGIFFPFMVLMLANLVITKKVKFKFIGLAAASIVLAYALVEPMRAASYGYQSDKKVGAGELVEMATTGVREKKITEENALPFLYVFMYRNSFGVFLSLSEKLVNHEHRFYPQFDTERKILYAPVLAYVPRSLWPDKPLTSNGGVMYNREILGAPDDDNVSITTATWGYFLLGTHHPMLYTIGFFFLLGMMQYYVYSLYRQHGLGGLIVCMGLLITFGFVDEAQLTIISYFRDLPIFLIFQFLFLYRFGSSTKNRLPPL